jgi:hypothetical protein
MRRKVMLYAAACAFVGAITLVLVLVTQTARPTESPFVYWPVAALIPLMIPFGTACIALGIGLLMLWFVTGMFASAQVVQPPAWAGLFILAMGVLGIVFGVAWGGSELKTQGSARAGSYVYHLAFRYTLNGDDEVYLFECDSLAIICRWRYRDNLARFFGAEESRGSTDSGLIVSEDGINLDIIINSQRVRTHRVPG